MKSRVVISVSAVYPGDLVADQEVWIIATAQCHKCIILHIASQGKGQNSDLKQFSLNAHCFCSIMKSKIISQMIVLGTVCFVTTMSTKIKKFTSLQKLPHAGLQYPSFPLTLFISSYTSIRLCIGAGNILLGFSCHSQESLEWQFPGVSSCSLEPNLQLCKWLVNATLSRKRLKQNIQKKTPWTHSSSPLKLQFGSLL